MAIGINDLDFDDELIEDNHQDFTDDNNLNDYEDSSSYDNDLGDVVTELLRKQGISDPSQINFENEDGSIEKLNWKDLSLEEQLNIINPKQTQKQEVVYNVPVNDEVLSLAEELEENNMSVDDFVNYIKQQTADELSQQVQPSYSVDSISDDDLYRLDLKNRIPDISDYELEEALNQAKSNELLYLKQIEGIRDEYRQYEEEQQAQEEAIMQEQQQQKFNEFANTIAESIENLDNVNGLDIELEDDDKQELAQFILGLDAAGVSHLGKALNDPETLVKVAWFALKGADALDGITNYFRNEITQVRERAYKKGLEDAKKSNNPRVAISSPVKQDKKYSSIHDLD